MVWSQLTPKPTEQEPLGMLNLEKVVEGSWARQTIAKFLQGCHGTERQTCLWVRETF